MKFYSILEGSQADINRRLLRLIRKHHNYDDSDLIDAIGELEELISALDERVKALEGEGEE